MQKDFQTQGPRPASLSGAAHVPAYVGLQVFQMLAEVQEEVLDGEPRESVRGR